MLRICYMSRATALHDEDAVGEILRLSHERNARDGITGLLLYDGERFLQAIEGPDDATAACYGRIHNDPRHDRLRLLVQTDAATREFGKWSMTYRRLTANDPAGFLETVRADVRQVSDGYLRMLFAGFAVPR